MEHSFTYYKTVIYKYNNTCSKCNKEENIIEKDNIINDIFTMSISIEIIPLYYSSDFFRLINNIYKIKPITILITILAEIV